MADLIIDAVQAVGVASATLVNVELTDQRGDAIVGYVSTSNQVIVLPTTVTTDINGQVTIDLIPNADIEPGNTCYTVRIAEKQFLIQKSANPQNLFDALVVDPGELDPIDQNALDDHINDPFNAHFGSAIGFVPFDTMTSDNVQDAIEETWTASVLGLNDASEINFTPTGDIGATNVQAAIVEVDAELHAHESDATDAHDASAISVVPFSTIAATNVQAALEEIVAEGSTGSAIDTTFTPTGDIVATNVQDAIVEVDGELHAHETDTVDAHDASAISFSPAGGISATDTQAAVLEARSDSFGYTDLHIADPTDAHDASAISFAPANVLDATDVQSAVVELGESFAAPKTPSGFPNTTDTTIAVVDSGADLTFTLAPVGASFDVWLFGDKFTKTTETVLLPDGVDAVYYIYYDAAGVLSYTTNSIQPLGFDWPTQVPVAIVFRNATAADLALFDTRHGLSMDWATRGYLHRTRGSQYVSGLVLSGYTLSPGAPADTDNTWGLSTGTIANEDLVYTIPAVTDEGTYTTIYKSGTASFSSSGSFGTAVPFAVSGSDIAYNLNTAGSYSLAPVPNGEFINYYIFVTGSATAGYQVFAFPEETTYATQALATAATIASPFTPGGFAFSEFFMRYRVTYQRSNAYTSTGRCRTVAVTQITNSQTLITSGSTPTSHNALSGRDVPDVHPASSVTFTPTGNIAATTVQAAIAEVETDAIAAYVPKDGSYAATTTSVVKSRVTGNANPRWEVQADGTHLFGNGTAVADVNLYRSGVDTLKTDDSQWVGAQLGVGVTPTSAAAISLPVGTAATQGILFGGDVALYRSATDTLFSDDSFQASRTYTDPAGTIQDHLLRTEVTLTAPSSASVTNAQFTGRCITGSSNLTGDIRGLTLASGASGSYSGTISSVYGAVLSIQALASSATFTQAHGCIVFAPSGTGAITNNSGFTIGSLGRAQTSNTTGLTIDAQTGSAVSDVSVKIAASTTQTLWVSNNANNTTANAGIVFGSSADTNLYRSAANTLKTDDRFIPDAGITLNGNVADPVGVPSLTWGNTTFTGATVSGAALMGGSTGATFNYTSGTANPSLFGWRNILILSGTTGGTLVGYDCDIRATNTGTWSGFGELTGNLRGVNSIARTVSGFTATGDAAVSLIGVRGTAAHSAGAGTIGQMYALVAASPLYTAGGTVTNGAAGLRVGNQGNSGYATAYGIRVDGITGSTSLNVGARIDASTERTLWLAGDSNPTTAAGGITFGSSADTNLYRSAANTLKTDDKLITTIGLGVGNSAAATTPGTVTRKMEVFDASGTSLGFVAIYDAIT